MTRANQQRAWSDPDLQTLKQMWWDGHSADTIRLALEARSRRSIQEKAQHEGFTRNPELKLNAEPNLFEVPQFMLPVMRAGGELVTIANVKTHECRWMESYEPTVEAPLCGRPTGKGPWCEYHKTRVYTAARTSAC